MPRRALELLLVLLSFACASPPPDESTQTNQDHEAALRARAENRTERALDLNSKAMLVEEGAPASEVIDLQIALLIELDRLAEADALADFVARYAADQGTAEPSRLDAFQADCRERWRARPHIETRAIKEWAFEQPYGSSQPSASSGEWAQATFQIDASHAIDSIRVESAPSVGSASEVIR